MLLSLERRAVIQRRPLKVSICQRRFRKIIVLKFLAGGYGEKTPENFDMFCALFTPLVYCLKSTRAECRLEISRAIKFK